MRHGVDPGDQGHGEPDELSVTARRLTAAAVAALVAALLLAGPIRPGGGAHASVSPAGVRPVVLVSGRTDHGERELSAVPLVAAPRPGAPRVALVADGTLVRVREVRGTWVRVAGTAGGTRRTTGWVDDFRLRGVVHLVGPAPSCRAVLRGRRLAAGEQATVLAVRGERARVRLVRRPTQVGWLPTSRVRELPPSPTDPCPAR